MTLLMSPPYRKMVSVGRATALEPFRKNFLASLHQLEKRWFGSKSSYRQAFSSAWLIRERKRDFRTVDIATRPWGNVFFPGALARGDIATLFAAADLYFWPGVNEAFGFSTLEAQAAGLPALVGNRAGICALTQPGRSALHHQPEDAAGFAAGLADLIDAPDRRAEMAKEARINVEKNHDINIVAQDLKALVDSVQASRKP